MRAVVQRVSEARVKVDGQTISQIGPGFLILLGICETDTQSEAAYLAEKCANLRVFEDADGKMNRSLSQSGGAILLVSNFTLYGDCKKGRRPNFIQAARPETAEPLYEYFAKCCEQNGISVQKGIFGADMQVSLIGDGPVTLILDTVDMRPD